MGYFVQAFRFLEDRMRRLINRLTAIYEAKNDKEASDKDLMFKLFGKEHLIPTKSSTYLKKSYFAATGKEGPNPLGDLGVAFWASESGDWARAEREDEGVEYDPKAWFNYLSRGTNGRLLKKIWGKLEYHEYSSPKTDKERLSASIVGKDGMLYEFKVFHGKNDVEFRNIVRLTGDDPRYFTRTSVTADDFVDAVG